MLTFDNGVKMVERVDELPALAGAHTIFADFETTSGSKTEKSVNPWHNCDVAGLGITVDDHKQAWYIPVGHHNGPNIDRDAFIDWWFDVVDQSKQWTNHNVKYDCHVSANALGVLVDPDYILKDTMTQAKIIDSDRQFKGGYSIDALSKHWLRHDISEYEDAMKPYLHNNKDYGAIPPDIMAPYAGQDVITARRLDKYIESRMPEECRRVSNTEIELTMALFEMEREGMRVDPNMLKAQEINCMNKMLELDEKMYDITGQMFRADNSADCYDILCNQYGLPVLGWTEDNNPSFDKDTLKLYLTHADAPVELVKTMLQYRSLSTFVSFFVKPYQELHVDGILHPSYNQAVRTGRMSCKKPNSQQLNKLAKSLIIPREGCAFFSIDDSQIEFRTIAHYTNNPAIVAAYNTDPWTDYHQLVAQLCGIKRKPAKTMNFLMGFGGGRALVEEALSSNLDLVGHLLEIAKEKASSEDQVDKIYKYLRNRKAKSVYDGYHEMVPELKRVSRKAAKVAEARGYVKNLLGRHRHLPADRAHIAFNTLNQSTAADLMKERIVTLRRKLKGTPIRYMAQVHDELCLTGPEEVFEDPRTRRDLVWHMSNPEIEMRVPVRCSYGISSKNWAEASAGETKESPEEGFAFEHLK